MFLVWPICAGHTQWRYKLPGDCTYILVIRASESNKSTTHRMQVCRRRRVCALLGDRADAHWIKTTGTHSKNVKLAWQVAFISYPASRRVNQFRFRPSVRLTDYILFSCRLFFFFFFFLSSSFLHQFKSWYVYPSGLNWMFFDARLLRITIEEEKKKIKQ